MKKPKVQYTFTKDGVKEMYQDTVAECFVALDSGTIDEMQIKIEIGNQIIVVPVNPDCMEDIFNLLMEWAEE